VETKKAEQLIRDDKTRCKRGVDLMSRGALFWGLVLVLFGTAFLLQNLNIIQVNLWLFLGPIFVILLGLWILLEPVIGLKSEHLSIPLRESGNYLLRISYGAGRLQIGPGLEGGNLLEGDFSGGVSHQSSQANGTWRLNLSMPTIFGPFLQSLYWRFRLNCGVPLEIEAEIGAAESTIDLSDLQVKSFRLSTGASSTSITLPAKAGLCKCVVKAGLAAVTIRIPEGVAARIQANAGLGEVNVDRNKFSKDKSRFESANYEQAVNKVDLYVEVGLGSIEIR
jgi:hypothetical protein